MMRTLSSCCTRSDISANKGFYFKFTNATVIEKIELISVGKTINYNSQTAHITLNPADSISKYKIVYDGGKSGTVEIAYTSKVVYLDDGCTETSALDILHTPRISGTTFSYAAIIGWNENPDNHNMYVEITP